MSRVRFKSNYFFSFPTPTQFKIVCILVEFFFLFSFRFVRCFCTIFFKKRVIGNLVRKLLSTYREAKRRAFIGSARAAINNYLNLYIFHFQFTLRNSISLRLYCEVKFIRYKEMNAPDWGVARMVWLVQLTLSESVDLMRIKIDEGRHINEVDFNICFRRRCPQNVDYKRCVRIT